MEVLEDPSSWNFLRQTFPLTQDAALYSKTVRLTFVPGTASSVLLVKGLALDACYNTGMHSENVRWAEKFQFEHVTRWVGLQAQGERSGV